MPLHMPYHSTMDKEVVKAAAILDSCFKSTVDADSAIPAEMIQNASGLAFLTVIKAGMIWTGKMGTGVVVARLEDGSWSPPSGIGTAGLGFGAEIGGEIIDFLIVLGSPSAVKTFKKGTQVSVGAGLDLAVGPVGRTAGASVNAGGGGVSGNYTYSHAKGAFAGVGLHGSTFMVRGEMNSQFYGRKVTPNEILSGQVAPPPGTCDVLFDSIRRACGQQGLGVEPNPNSFGSGRTSNSNSYHSNGTPDAADHAAAARASFSGTRTSSISNSFSDSNRQLRTSSSTSSSLPAPTTTQADPNDPRLRRYSSYKSERELYAQFEQRKSGVAPPVPTESTHSHPTNPSLKYKSYPAPAPNSAYTAPPQAQAMYNSFVQPSAPKAPQQSVPSLPSSVKGAEMKQVYSEVMNFVQTKCPYANLQVFKDNCRLFGQDAMSLDAFFSYLLSICSHPQMKELVPQLVRLLPTQEKRERLWTSYLNELAGKKTQRRFSTAKSRQRKQSEDVLYCAMMYVARCPRLR
ncbi:SH3 domain-containing protein [Phytophthora ramorum]|uniref:SH3 domain-containing protein n=1 Tax=Phytophthora ramorum TaxID=164328 RepID=UPI0030B73E9A|nr:SH3 domain-containing protein [Phytophthora ramorum]